MGEGDRHTQRRREIQGHMIIEFKQVFSSKETSGRGSSVRGGEMR